MIGSTISHYHVLSELGRGGMGVVYKAEDTKLDRAVALKFLPTPLVADPEAKERFIQEAKAASILDHQNICTIHEIGESEDGQVFIAMACYDGLSLKEKIGGIPLPVDAAVNYGMQAAEGLSVAHEAGIIHRDIKPGNLMVTSRDIVKILDFGLAKMTDMTLTTSGTRLGTVIYMSPEQARGERVDHRTDIWSLGAVLYEMLTGVKPFEAPYETAVFYAIINIDPKPPREYNPEIPELLEEIVLCCLAKDPADRYDSAAALANDLRRFSAGEKLLALPTIGIRTRVHIMPSRRTAISLTLLAIIITILAIAPIRRFVFMLPDPLRDHLALGVLPFVEDIENPEDVMLVEGFAHYISRILTNLEQFHQPMWVAPYSHSIYYGVDTSADFAGELFVDMTVRPQVVTTEDEIFLTVDVEEARTGERLRQRTQRGEWSDISEFQENLLSTLSGLLDIRLSREVRDVFASRSTSDPDAFRSWILGLGYHGRPFDQGNRQRALELFQEAAEIDSSFAIAFVSLGAACLVMWGFEKDDTWLIKALRYTTRTTKLDSTITSAHLLSGRIHHLQGRKAEAEGEYRTALILNPKSRDAYTYLAELLEEGNRIQEAESIFVDAIASNPSYWLYYESLGILLDRELRHDDAIPHFERMIELASDNAWGYTHLASQHLRLGNDTVAESLFTKATTVNASAIDAPANAYYNLGRIRYQNDQFGEAADYYRQSVNLDSTEYDAWSDLGNAYHWLGNRDEAEAAWRNVIALTEDELAMIPGTLDALEMLSLTQAKLKLEAEATATIELLLTLERVPVGTYVSIGEAYEILDQRDRALTFIKKAVSDGYSRAAIEASRWLDELTQDRSYQCQFIGDPCEE